MIRIRTLQSRNPQSVRFDRERSPSNVNDGKGWNADAARAFLVEHEMEGLEAEVCESYIRFKQFPPGDFIDTYEAAPGVTLILCRKSA